MTIQEICDKAEQVAKQYNPEGVAPFPFEHILQNNTDLMIYLVDLENGVSGAISYDKENKKFEIFINKSKPTTRQNFTIAHELGHYFLHKDIINTEGVLIDGENHVDGPTLLYRLDESESSRVETEANNFAASLLMPSELVKKAWNELRSIEECAKIFNVSTIAMAIRLERLGLING